MTPARILVVDDELSVRNLLQRFLQREGYRVEAVADGQESLTRLKTFKPNLVILDLNLPDMSGYEICQLMQQETGVYVLMLTSRSSPADKLQGFHQGADDYLTKPFNLPELGARVAAILKRQRTASPVELPILGPALQIGDLVIDPAQREVRRLQQVIPLTTLEFDLVLAMARHPGKVWRRAELIQAVWDFSHNGDERVVDVHIGQIRKKLEIDPSQPEWILTVRGVGYKFASHLVPDAGDPEGRFSGQ